MQTQITTYKKCTTAYYRDWSVQIKNQSVQITFLCIGAEILEVVSAYACPMCSVHVLATRHSPQPLHNACDKAIMVSYQIVYTIIFNFDTEATWCIFLLYAILDIYI